MVNITSLEHTHDLRLPAWGPYTKKYTGISHLPDLASGLRFDLSVFPGYYRRQALIVLLPRRPVCQWKRLPISGEKPVIHPISEKGVST